MPSGMSTLSRVIVCTVLVIGAADAMADAGRRAALKPPGSEDTSMWAVAMTFAACFTRRWTSPASGPAAADGPDSEPRAAAAGEDSRRLRCGRAAPSVLFKPSF